MEEILARCADAADKLDAESDRFDDLRDLRSRLPQVLAELPGQIEAQQARIGAVGATLQRLQQRYAPTALTSVSANVDEATKRLDFARSSLRQAEQLAVPGASAGASSTLPAVPGPGAVASLDAGAAVSPPVAGQQNPGAPSVLAAGAAQEAVGQAQTLLDAIEHTDADLGAAVGQLTAAATAVDAELSATRNALTFRRRRKRRTRAAGAARPDPGDPGRRPVAAGSSRPADRPAQAGGGGRCAGQHSGRHSRCPAGGAARAGRAGVSTVRSAGRDRLRRGFHRDPTRCRRQRGPNPAGRGETAPGQCGSDRSDERAGSACRGTAGELVGPRCRVAGAA